MAVQVSHRIYSEIPETAAIRSSEETSRGSVSSIGKAEVHSRARDGGSQARSACARNNTTVTKTAKNDKQQPL